MLSWISHMLDRIFAVIVALILMQFPLFIDQYMIKLSGNVDELNYQMQKIEQVAQKTKKTPDAYIQKFLQNDDPDFSEQGKFLLAMQERTENLSQALQSLRESGPFTRPFIFMVKSDHRIVRSTYHTYQPGISFSIESIFYGFIGILLGYYIYRLISYFFERVINGLHRAKKNEITKL